MMEGTGECGCLPGLPAPTSLRPEVPAYGIPAVCATPSPRLTEASLQRGVMPLTVPLLQVSMG